MLVEMLQMQKWFCGGWVACRGMKAAYTIENINLVVSGCP